MLRFVPRDDRIFTEEKQVQLHPLKGVAAALLFARGIETAEEAQRFLNPSEDQLHDPYLLSGMREAVDILNTAKTEGWDTVVYGDYDTDGICAAALLTQALTAHGIKAAPYLPMRDDGYGLNKEAVRTLAKTYRLLVTVDLGITNADEVALAKELGMTVIVTDHHQLGLAPCPADAVINPLMNDYPFPKLCGAGVAYKLAMALLDEAERINNKTVIQNEDGLVALQDAKNGTKSLPQNQDSLSVLQDAKNGTKSPSQNQDGLVALQDAIKRAMPLAAVATVADIVSLTGENRVIVALGLPMIAEHVGLKALIDIAGCTLPIDEGDVGFQIAPRLNAAGRIGDANAAVRLLMTDDPKEAAKIAAQLDTANTQRKRLEGDALAEAEKQAETHDFVRRHVLFVQGTGWHKGVIGLVAGRLNRRYAVPVCAFSEEDGMLHGSLRGVEGVNLAECLKQCDDLLVKYGGHAMAAGVTLTADKALDFQNKLEETVRESAAPESFVPRQDYDVRLGFADATGRLVDAVAQLRPFGADNPAPVFITDGAQLAFRRTVGANDAHLKLRLRHDNTLLDGIAFGMGAEAAALPETVDAAYTLERNEFRGRVSIQCRVHALRPDTVGLEKALESQSDAIYREAMINRMIAQAGKGAFNEENLVVAPSLTPPTDELLDGCQGTLLVAYTKRRAMELLQTLGRKVDVAQGSVQDPRCFHTLLIRPDTVQMLPMHWRHIVLEDGALTPADAAHWQALCPHATVVVRKQSREMLADLSAMDAGDDRYRDLYKLLRRSLFASLQETARAAGMEPAQVLLGLHAFDELGLINLTRMPFAIAMRPPEKCDLADSALLRYIRHTVTEWKPGRE